MFKRLEGVQFMQGNEACAYAAMDAGVRFFAGYPITPSSEVAEVCSLEMPKRGGIYLQMEDEIASMAAIVGASLSGAKAFTSTSGPGFSLMQENLGMAIYAEVPCVIVNVQRVGPSTGLATRPAQGDVMQAKWGTHGDHPIVALSPESVQEMYDLTVDAFNIAEKYRTPVILLADEIIGHSREKLQIPTLEELNIVNRKLATGDPKNYLPYQADDDGVPPFAKYGSEYILHASSSCHDSTGYSNSNPEVAVALLKRLFDKIDNGADDIIKYEYFGRQDAEVVIIAYGCVSRTAKQVVVEAKEQGLAVGLFRPKTLWPFPEKEVQQILAQGKKVIVPEMNYGQILLEVQRLNQGNSQVYGISRTDGELVTPEEILTKIKEVL